MSGSLALATNDIWSKTIGFDPYAAENAPKKSAAEEAVHQEQAAGLMLIARMSNISGGKMGDNS